MHSVIRCRNTRPKALRCLNRMLNSLRQDVTQKLAQIRPISPEEQKAMMEQYEAQQRAAQAAAAPEATCDGGRGNRLLRVPGLMKTTSRPGAIRRAMTLAPVVPAISSNIVTANWPDTDCGNLGAVFPPLMLFGPFLPGFQWFPSGNIP